MPSAEGKFRDVLITPKPERGEIVGAAVQFVDGLVVCALVMSNLSEGLTINQIKDMEPADKAPFKEAMRRFVSELERIDILGLGLHPLDWSKIIRKDDGSYLGCPPDATIQIAPLQAIQAVKSLVINRIKNGD